MLSLFISRPILKHSALLETALCEQVGKMTFCELGLRIEDLLARHGVKPDSQLALKRAIMDVVERWDGSQTHFSLDSGEFSSP